MRLARILDGQIMQAELRLHPLQELRAGLVEANPDDVARALRPLARFLDGDILDPASAAVDATTPASGPAEGTGFCSVLASTFSNPSFAGSD